MNSPDATSDRHQIGQREQSTEPQESGEEIPRAVTQCRRLAHARYRVAGLTIGKMNHGPDEPRADQ